MFQKHDLDISWSMSVILMFLRERESSRNFSAATSSLKDALMQKKTNFQVKLGQSRETTSGMLQVT